MAPGPQHELTGLLRDQSGMVTLAQLRNLNIDRSTTRAHVRAKRWRRIHPGVYASFTGPLPDLARLWTAVLATGPEAVVGRAAAAWLRGLRPDLPRTITLLVPHIGGPRAAPTGVAVVRSRRLEQIRHPALQPPRTTVEDTVLDLVDEARTERQVIDVVLRACQNRRTTPGRLAQAASRRQRLRWRALTRELLADAEAGVSSPLERRYARDVERAHGLPRGQRNETEGPIGRRRYRDVRYRRWRLVVELDGRAAHPRDEQELDDVRDNEAVEAFERTLRYGWRSVTGTPCEVAGQVARLLRLGGWTGRPVARTAMRAAADIGTDRGQWVTTIDPSDAESASVAQCDTAPVLSAEEARVLAAVDERWILDRLRALIAIPSVTGSAAENEAQHLVAGWLEELGLDVDLWPIDLAALAADPDYPGTEVPRTQSWGLAGTLGGSDRPALAFTGHVDVVPPGDRRRWTRDPFAATVVDGYVVGRGACDMKGGLVAALAAVAAIRASGVRLRRGLAVHSVGGEEDGGLGALATLRRGHLADACVIPEPTDGRLITANAGALGFRLEVEGRSAHGAVRDTGVSALEVFLPVHRALLALEAERNREVDPRFVEHDRPYALSIGMVQAGDWASTVPDRLVAEGRYGVRLGESPAAARSAFEAAVAAVADPWLAEHPARVTWSGGQFASGTVPAGHPLPGWVRAAVAAVTGTEPPERAAPYGSDLRLYAGAGIPTVHYGPGQVRFAHAPDERVSIEEVVQAARVLAVLALRVCGPR